MEEIERSRRPEPRAMQKQLPQQKVGAISGLAPEPGGTERNSYYETITYTAIGDVTNAESPTLAALHYREIVQRGSNDEVFHDETGY